MFPLGELSTWAEPLLPDGPHNSIQAAVFDWMAGTPRDGDERNKQTPIDDNEGATRSGTGGWSSGGVTSLGCHSRTVLERYTLVKETIHNEAN